LWYQSEPDFGKSKWIGTEFAGKRIFHCGGGKFPFEGYSGEPIIVLDDVIIPLSFILTMSNVATSDYEQVPGDTRYRKYWKAKGVRIRFIVLSNYHPEKYFYRQTPGMTAD